MKYLLQAIDARRECVRLSDHELRDLLIEVRSGKDDRIEFTESMVRLVEELKNSEHATAFLTKVAKRDAPDYYDVIKNPMDLGTMLRNVRQGRYKSKAQFMRDLDLIWDNCLTYNSEPTHPLRRSVQMLRSKANHLMTYVNDTNDVKEALNQWQASIGLQRRPSEPPHSADGDQPDDAAAVGDVSTIAGRDRMGSSLGLARLSGGGSAVVDMPFEQRPALLRNADGMATFARLDASLAALDEDFARRYLNAGAGPSSHTLDGPADQGLSTVASLDMLKTLEGPHGGVLRKALTTPAEDDAGQQQADKAAIPYPLEWEDPEEEARAPYDVGAAWWNSMAHPSLLPAGIMPLAGSEQTAHRRARYMAGRPGKRRRIAGRDLNGEHERMPFGGTDALERNVKTIFRLRRTHNKYGRLHSHIESGEPIPADLGVLSSDEEGEEEDEDGVARKRPSDPANATKQRQKAPDMLMLPISEMAGNPYPKLGGEQAANVLQRKTNLLLAHTGFDGSHKAAADVLADVAGEFLMNVGRTLRTYTDRFANEMSVEDLILHTLYENGGMDVRSLESYVADDVLRYGNKMADLLRKLRASYRDTLATSDVTMADEAAYFDEEAQQVAAQNVGGAAQVNGDVANGGDEHILRGGYARELADEDFFGFKDMGLDAELGIDVGRQLASMPSRMFSRRAQNDGGAGGPPGSAAKGRLLGSIESGRSMVDFEPPPPFVPLSEAAIAAQIGLLRPFYRDLIRTRGQWQRVEGQDDGDETMMTTTTTAAVDAGEDGAEGDRTEANKDAYVILPDEEQERQRYKVPPNGKMPKRMMKQQQQQQQQQQPKTKQQQPTTNDTSVGADAHKSQASQNGKSAPNGNGATKSKAKGGGGGKKKETGAGATKQQHAAHAVTVS